MTTYRKVARDWRHTFYMVIDRFSSLQSLHLCSRYKAKEITDMFGRKLPVPDRPQKGLRPSPR